MFYYYCLYIFDNILNEVYIQINKSVKANSELLNNVKLKTILIETKCIFKIIIIRN